MKKITFYSQIPQKATSLKNMKLICIFFLYIFPQPAGIFYRLKIEEKCFPCAQKYLITPSVQTRLLTTVAAEQTILSLNPQAFF